MKKNKKHSRTLLTFIFSAMVFFTLTVTMFIVGGIALFLSEIGILEKGYHYGRFLPLITFALTSIVTGTIVATIASFVPLKPAENLINGLKQLASGDYSIRIEKGKHHLVKGISDNFNLLAEELENTEMLKSDFVNNFSHEFKTPIEIGRAHV